MERRDLSRRERSFTEPRELPLEREPGELENELPHSVAPQPCEGLQVKKPHNLATQRPSFVYPALEGPTKQIRLLQFDLVEDIRLVSAPIRCSLQVATLAESSRRGYHVLSYCWGDVQDTKPIYINGQLHYITTNLEAALRKMRESYQDVFVWADAICINQTDLEEKAVQVDMMASIFSSATLCVIWLGDTSLSPETRPNTIFETAAENAFNLIESLARNEHYTRPGNSGKPLLGPLMDLQWWHRIWTVQEVVLPPQCIVMCGSFNLSWESLIEASTNFRHHHYQMCCSRAVTSLKHFHAKMNAIESTRKEAMSAKGINMIRTFQKFQDRATWDPRDKVYGLLALGAQSPTGVTITAGLGADYTLHTRDVFIRTTRRLLQQTRKLDVLLRAREYRRDPTLPSWVPDWMAENDRHRIRELERWFTWESHNACGDKEADFGDADAISDPEILHLAGVKIDAIITVGAACEDPLALSAAPEGPIVMTFPDSQWRALLAKTGINVSLYPFKTTSYIEAFMRVLARDSIQDSYDIDTGVMERRIRPDDVAACLREIGSSKQHLTYYQSKMINRRFFITTSGLIGTGPVDTAVGDSVFVLFGGNLPFILRQTAIPTSDGTADVLHSTYKFVGDAYVYGAMDGEYADEAKKEWVVLE